MSDPRESRPSKREQLAKMQRTQPFQGKERIRLVAMVGGLVFVIGLFLWIRFASGGDSGDPDAVAESTEQYSLGADIQFPEVDAELLAEVEDDESVDRVELEPGPFSMLLKAGRGLLPGHLEVMGSPRLPFADVRERSDQFRGLAFQERGEVRFLEIYARAIGEADETWALIRTDEGEEYWYVSLIPPTELFGPGGNYVVTEGFYFKLYTRSFENQDGERERVTAPLLVGRELRPSVRKIEPVMEVDPLVLAGVRDAEFREDRPLEDAGYWHLMSYARNLREDQDRVAQEWQEAVPLDAQAIRTLVDQPGLYRGRPFRLYGRTTYSFWRACGENPLRLKYASHGFLYKWELDDQYIRLAAPGRTSDARSILENIGLNSELLVYFHKMWAYVDKDDQPRRVPVFVVASMQPRETKRSPLEREIVLVFLGLFALGLVGFAWLIRRDRKQAEVAAAALRARRRRAGRDGPTSS